MTTAAGSFRPPWAVTAWIDDTHVYIEIAATSGPPYITKFSNTEGGLSKALNYMRNLHRVHRPKGSKFTPPPAAKRPLKPIATDAQREKVRALLKKRGIV